MRKEIRGNRVVVYDDQGNVVSEREAEMGDVLELLLEKMTREIEMELNLAEGKARFKKRG
jgi:hypothetical protein